MEKNIFALGNSVTVDPRSRKVVAIDGVPVPEKEHTKAMEAFAENALADFAAPSSTDEH